MGGPLGALVVAEFVRAGRGRRRRGDAVLGEAAGAAVEPGLGFREGVPARGHAVEVILPESDGGEGAKFDRELAAAPVV